MRNLREILNRSLRENLGKEKNGIKEMRQVLGIDVQLCSSHTILVRYVWNVLYHPKKMKWRPPADVTVAGIPSQV